MAGEELEQFAGDVGLEVGDGAVGDRRPFRMRAGQDRQAVEAGLAVDQPDHLGLLAAHDVAVAVGGADHDARNDGDRPLPRRSSKRRSSAAMAAGVAGQAT